MSSSHSRRPSGPISSSTPREGPASRAALAGRAPHATPNIVSRAIEVAPRLAPIPGRPLPSRSVITGMIDDWPAMQSWHDPRYFSSRFGSHRVLAKRASFGYSRAGASGVAPEAASVGLAELVQRTQTEHIIVLDEDKKGESEEKLLTDLNTEYSNPELLDSLSQIRVFSFGGGARGVQMMQHGVAWLGLVAGVKLWHLAPPTVPKPSDISCEDGGRIDYERAEREGVSHCLLNRGEVVFVPEAWWHATCNLDDYTVGVGGQIWRPGKMKVFETVAERTKPMPGRTPDSFYGHASVRGVELPDESPAIIFDEADGWEEGYEADDEAAEGEMVGVEVGAMGGGDGPAEIHALRGKQSSGVGKQADMMGAPRDASFVLPGAYKREWCDLERVHHSAVDRSVIEGSPRPFIIDGLAENWTALDNWKLDAMIKTHGDSPFHLHHTYNRTLSALLDTTYKYHMGHAVFPAEACYSDPYRPYSPFLFDQLGKDYELPAYFHPMSTFQMGIGRGAGVGVPPENHPSSFFAAIVGRKKWMLHPDNEPEPKELMVRHGGGGMCERRLAKSATTLECEQREGEIIWVPNYWWHETCGLDDYSVGVGGITYKGCCDDMRRHYPKGESARCTENDDGAGVPYGLVDIPFCVEKPEKCPTLPS